MAIMLFVTTGLWMRFIALLLLQVTAGHARQHVGQQLGRILHEVANATGACAEAVASGLANTNVAWQTNGTIQHNELVAVIDSVFSTESSCSPLQSTNTSDSVLLTWMQYPGWLNGALTEWVWHMKSEPTTAAELRHVLFNGPQQLPPPAAITTPEGMRDYAVTHNNDVHVYSSDLSGFSPSYTVEQRGVADYPENACLNKSVPRGPLHPRNYLLLFYRPDVLAALHAAGYTSSKDPPADWEATLAILKAHAEALRQNGGGSRELRLPPHGLCVTTDITCGRAGDLLAAIAASVLQYGGTQYGYVFNLSVAPPAASSLVGGGAWRYAADVLRQLLGFNAGDEGENESAAGDVAFTRDCHIVSPWFTAGHCLMTFDWDMSITAMAVPALQSPLGALAVAPLPGSRVVAAVPASGTTAASSSSSAAANVSTVSCSSMLCAVSANHDLLYLTSAGQREGVLAAARGAAASCESGSVAKMEAAAAATAGNTANAVVVNRAPYSVLYDYYIDYKRLAQISMARETFIVPLGLASRLSSERLVRQNALDTLHRAVAAVANLNNNNSTTNGSTNGTNSTVSNSIPVGAAFMATPWWGAPFVVGGYDKNTTAAAAFPAEALSPYIAHGLDTGTIMSYFRAVWHASHSPNLAPDVAAPAMVNWYKWALGHAAVLMLPPHQTTNTSSISSSSNTSTGMIVPAPAAAVDEALALLVRVWEQVNTAYTPAVVRSGYEAVIGADKWLETGEQSSGAGHSTTLDAGTLAAVVASVVASAALAGVLLLLLLRLRSRHRDLLGRVLAPRAGPDTTMLISDIQSSTALWEQLPVAVMDVTLKLHHDTIRRLLLQYDGYESATEGDSFILAFPDPARAVAFTAACQVSLMLQEWPAELLLQPDAAPVLVLPQEGEAAQHAGMPGGDSWRHNGRPAARGSLLARLAAPAAYLSSRVRVAATLLRASAAPAPLVTRSAADTGAAMRGVAFRSGNSIGGFSGEYRYASMFYAGFDMTSRYGPLVSGLRRSMEQLMRSAPGPESAAAHQGCPVPAGAIMSPPVAAPAGSVMYLPRQPPFQSPHVVAGSNNRVAAAATESKLLPLDLPGSAIPPPPTNTTTTTAITSSSAIPTKNVTFHGLPASPRSRATAAAAADTSSELPTDRTGPALGPTKPTSACKKRASVGSEPPRGGSPSTASPRVADLLRDSIQNNAGVDAGGGAGDGGGGGPNGGNGGNSSCGGRGGSGYCGDVSNPMSKLFAARDEWDQSRTPNGPPSVTAVCEWVLGPSRKWGEQLQSVFPVTPTEEVPAAVMAGQALKSPWVMLPSGQLALLAFRGLRVRMGLHTGLADPSHVTFNRVASAYMYSGSFAELTKCASEAATGGLVVLSSQTFVRLRNTINTPGTSGLPRGAPETVVVYAGHHMPQLKPPPPPLMALSPTSTAKALARAKLQLTSALSPSQPHGEQQQDPTVQVNHQAGQSRMSYSVVHVRFDAQRPLQTPPKAANVVGGTGTGPSAMLTVSQTGTGDHGNGPLNLRGGNGAGEGYAWYQAVPLTLTCRLALCSPIVSARALQLGTLAAPIGCICVAFMYVVGASTLLADIPGPAARALDQFQRLVCSLLGARGGYLVEGGEGLVLAAFDSPNVAVEWALDCLAKLKKLDWEYELLGHWLCEEVLSVGLAGADSFASLEPSLIDSDAGSPDPLTVTTASASATPQDSGTASPAGPPTAAPSESSVISRAPSPEQLSRSRTRSRSRAPSPTFSTTSTRRQLRRGLSHMPSMARLGTMAVTKRVLERGLRIKVGLDVGYASHSLNETSGRLSYRGKVMNRASRVAGKAAAGQVVCTDAVWRACLSTPLTPYEWDEDEDIDSEAGLGLVGVSLGKVVLRGVSAPVELVQCMRG